MAIDFPASPTNGQTHTVGSTTWTWDGTKWGITSGAAGATDKIEEGNTSAEVIDTGSDGRFVVTTEGTERARVDSSGRLLVGNTTATSATGSWTQYTNLHVIGGIGTNNGGSIFISRNTDAASSTNQDLGWLGWGTNEGATFARIAAFVEGTPTGSSFPGLLRFETTPSGGTAPVERMRIISSGFLKATSTGNYFGATGTFHEIRSGSGGSDALAVSHTTSSGPSGIGVYYTAASPNNTGSHFLTCADSTTNRAIIRSNGGLANYSANNANLSDRNAKKDISPAAGTWDCIKEWEIVNYRYKDQPDDADLNLGVIAQQVAESCPEVITVFQEATEDQPEKLGVKEQQMYWMAIKALQEAQVRIETLEAQNASLEARLTALEGGTP